MKRMMKLRRIICAIFGHQHELFREVELSEGEDICLYTCKRCGQTSWFIKWDGAIEEVAVWNRELTDEEMQILKEFSGGEIARAWTDQALTKID